MKIILSILFSIGSLSAATPIGWWKLDGNILDFSGNNYTGTLINAPTYVAGKINQGLSFNGTNQAASTPTISVASSSAMSISFWFNSAFSTQSMIAEFSPNFNTSSGGWMIYQNAYGTNTLGIELHGEAGYFVNSYTAPSANAWHHYVAIFQKASSNPQVQLYIDGVLKTAASTPFASINTNTFSNNQLFLMSRAGTSSFTAGILDDVRLFNVALTQNDVTAIYNPGPLPPAPPPPPGPHVVTLAWDPPLAGNDVNPITNFNIYQSIEGSAFSQVGQVAANTFQFQTPIKPMQYYRWTATSVDSIGSESVHSNSVDLIVQGKLALTKGYLGLETFSGGSFDLLASSSVLGPWSTNRTFTATNDWSVFSMPMTNAAQFFRYKRSVPPYIAPMVAVRKMIKPEVKLTFMQKVKKFFQYKPSVKKFDERKGAQLLLFIKKVEE